MNPATYGRTYSTSISDFQLSSTQSHYYYSGAATAVGMGTNPNALTGYESTGMQLANSFTGVVSEVMYFDHALSTAQRQAVTLGLIQKWGTGSLGSAVTVSAGSADLSAADTGTGALSYQHVTGSNANESYTVKGTDVVSAQGGDDTIVIKDGDFRLLDGGSGNDTLHMNYAGELSLSGAVSSYLSNASGLHKLERIEKIDLSGDGAKTLVLSQADVLQLSDNDSLIVQGEAGDAVVALGNWTLQSQSVTAWDTGVYKVYTNGVASLLVSSNITVVSGVGSSIAPYLTLGVIGTLSVADLNALDTSVVNGLSDLQVAALTQSQIAGLSSAFLDSLNTNGKIDNIAVSAVSGLDFAGNAQSLTVDILSALTNTQLGALSQAQGSAMNTTELGVIKTRGGLAYLSAAFMTGLGTSELVSLGADGIALLTDTQVSGLTATQLVVMAGTADLINDIATTAIDSLSFVGLTAAQTTAVLEDLTSDQMSSLTATQGGKIAANQLDTVSTADFSELSTAFIGGLTAETIATVETAQLQSMTDDQIGAFTDAQVAALIAGQKTALAGRTVKVVVGTSSGDFLNTGTSGNDIFLAGAGNDTIVLTAGNDRIHGGAGFDTVQTATSGGGTTLNLVNQLDTSSSFKTGIERVNLGANDGVANTLNLDAHWLATQGTAGGIYVGSTAGGGLWAVNSGSYVLSANAAAAVGKRQIVVDGGGSNPNTDTLNLSNAWTNTTSTVSNGTNTYNVYTRTVNGTALEVFVRTGVTVNTTLSGTVDGVAVAGPMLSSLDVLVYAADGTQLTSTSTDAQGHFSLEGLNGYSGSMLLVMRDKNGAAADYKDEFSGANVDLSTSLRAVVDFTGAATDLSVTPLTELATRLMNVTADNHAPSAALASEINAALGSAFGVTDVLGKATAVNDSTAAANVYGKMLGALSLTDYVFGDMSTAMDVLSRSVTLTTDGAGHVTGAAIDSNIQSLLTLGFGAMNAYEGQNANGDAAGLVAAGAYIATQSNIVMGSASANTLTGTAGTDKIFGLAGDDTIVHTAGNDLVFGGAGVDTYSLGSTSAQTVSLGNLYGVEKIDLSGAGNNSLSLTLSSVLNNGASGLLTHGTNGWDFSGIATAGKVQLLVDGDASGAVGKTDATAWTHLASTVSHSTHTYDVYEATLNNVTAQLLVDHNISRVL